MNDILFSYNLYNNGKSTLVSHDNAREEIENAGLTWVHLNLNHHATRNWLEKEIDCLDPFITDALLADETRPRITHINDGILINLRGTNLNEGANPSDMVSIRLWIDKNRIISVQRRQLKAIYDIQNLIVNNQAPKNAGEFICLLIDKILYDIAGSVTNIEEKMDSIEEEVITKPEKSLREKIMHIRSEAISYRRYLLPQRDVILELEKTYLSWINKSDKRKLQENYDIVTRYVEDLESLRERSHIIKDELMNSLSDTLNRNLYILSVVSAIFLPLHFFAGLLGVNLAGIPKSGNPMAFTVFCMILMIVVAIQIFFFKKHKIF